MGYLGGHSKAGQRQQKLKGGGHRRTKLDLRLSYHGPPDGERLPSLWAWGGEGVVIVQQIQDVLRDGNTRPFFQVWNSGCPWALQELLAFAGEQAVPGHKSKKRHLGTWPQEHTLHLGVDTNYSSKPLPQAPPSGFSNFLVPNEIHTCLLPQPRPMPANNTGTHSEQ